MYYTVAIIIIELLTVEHVDTIASSINSVLTVDIVASSRKDVLTIDTESSSRKAVLTVDIIASSRKVVIRPPESLQSTRLSCRNLRHPFIWQAHVTNICAYKLSQNDSSIQMCMTYKIYVLIYDSRHISFQL
jgi:hypothetical protein